MYTRSDSMDKTIFIASFPDLTAFDFSNSGIKFGEVDPSEYAFNDGKFTKDYVSSYTASLKNKVGTCDIVLLPPQDKIISSLEQDGIKVVVLYPDINQKEAFIEKMHSMGVEGEYLSTVSNTWEYMISRLQRRNYDYKFVLYSDDNFVSILKILLATRKSLGVSRSDIAIGISEDLVTEIFKDCLLNLNEVKEGQPISPHMYCHGVKYDYLMSSDRLEKRKGDISSLLDYVKDIDSGIDFPNMKINTSGNTWTNSDNVIDHLLILGLATDQLVMSDSLNDQGIAYVTRKREKVKETLL